MVGQPLGVQAHVAFNEVLGQNVVTQHRQCEGVARVELLLHNHFGPQRRESQTPGQEVIFFFFYFFFFFFSRTVNQYHTVELPDTSLLGPDGSFFYNCQIHEHDYPSVTDIICTDSSSDDDSDVDN